MRKIREVLRLRFELRLGQRAIARACSISQSTVHEYLNRAAAAGVVWPLGEEWDEQRVEQALFGERTVVKRLPEQVLPDFPALHSQLQQHRHLTLQLAWEEYRQIHPEGYGYSRFCELYQRWRRKQDVVLRQVHKPGEKGFVDWAGATIPVHDPVTGEVWAAALFVMVLGASSYTYAEATRDQQLSAWISAHMHAFEYFSGVPRLLVPDNLRTGVSRACRYDPDLNPTYQEFAMHYDVGVVPARPRHPKDKAKVEVGVQVVERWIIAALRHQKFFRLADLNQAIRELLERLNQRPFRKREGSRASVFAAVERNALRPLPAEPFDMSQWSYARVNIDYHIAFDANLYSVPYTLVQERVEVRATPTTIEIFHKGQRVASHVRGHGREQVFTQREHRPKSHQAHLEWTPSRMVHWAEQIGRHTAKLFERILAEKPHPEMGYRSCLGIIRLAEEYSPARMEAAADRAIRTGACRYQSVKSILKNSLDQQPLPEPLPLPLPPSHDNIRGAEYFE
ncbi:MAG: IS21 family transposase [Acidobacteria bacterium]|nr:MAG: IS21 family transposase [Acidobacteriota bacterium]PYU38153.1 MAG: IS21 family transposase [Acidobacteriota bacterium]